MLCGRRSTMVLLNESSIWRLCLRSLWEFVTNVELPWRATGHIFVESAKASFSVKSVSIAKSIIEDTVK